MCTVFFGTNHLGEMGKSILGRRDYKFANSAIVYASQRTEKLHLNEITITHTPWGLWCCYPWRFGLPWNRGAFPPFSGKLQPSFHAPLLTLRTISSEYTTHKSISHFSQEPWTKESSRKFGTNKIEMAHLAHLKWLRSSALFLGESEENMKATDG